MNDQTDVILAALRSWWPVIPIVIALILWRQILWLLGIQIVPQNGIGIVNKKLVLFGDHRALPDGKLIALAGEAGMQADTLAPGIYFGYWPWQFQVTVQKFITVDQGMVGVVEARDGIPIPAGRVLGKAIECDSFQSARAFLANGGERGPQIAVVPPGTYRINTSLFTVQMAPATVIPDNQVGIVTTREGQPLPSGDIAGKPIADHNLYQDAQKFVDNGGFKGLQVQVILAGMYYLNPLFATVQGTDMTEVPIGYVGVVVAYVGEEAPQQPSDPSASPKERQIRVVERGSKGVWRLPYDPGKYPINPYTHKVENVPTTNIVLNWANNKSEAHELDKNLSTIKVRSQDGFTFNLDVSQIIHVPRENAPKVIARFGTMLNLVTQVLEPSIGNYFRNAAQESDVIAFLAKRADRQKAAKDHIQEALAGYDVQAVDTLIGDIATPPELMKTLTDRKIAEQEIATYNQQRAAQDARPTLAESTALADTKAQVVDSLRQVEIRTNLANAKIAEAKGDAQSKTINAEADARVYQVTGEGEAKKTLAVGEAEAAVLQKKVEAVGQQGYVAMQVADFLATNKIALVPNFLVSAGGEAKSGMLVDAFLGSLLAKEAGLARAAGAPPAAEKPAS